MKMLSKIVSFLTTIIAATLLVPVAGQGGTALREFTDELTGELFVNPNDCTSSWGVSMVFDLLRPGTDDAAALDQMCNVVGLCGDDNTNQLLWEGAVARLEAEYDGSCGNEPFGTEDDCRPLLLIANSVWVDDESELAQPYNETVREFVKQIDFLKEDAGGIVNGWVNQSTLGLIDSIIAAGEISADLIAINTIYLNAAWQTFFSEEMTSSEIFHVDESTTIEAHFMHLVLDPKEGDVEYSHNALDGYQLLKLHFQETSSLSMVFVLPLLDDLSGTWTQADHTEKLKNLASVDIKAALGNLEWENKVAVVMPKFKYESEYKEELKSALQSLGLTAPFDLGSSVFCGMWTGPCLFIGDIIQKTSIDVNEKGVIAAAATAVVLVGAPPGFFEFPTQPALFLADRPFKFFIYDEQEDIFLFEGFVSSPNIPEGSSAPFEGSHHDGGFWTGNFDIDFAPKQPTKFGGELLPSCSSNLLYFILQILFGWNIAWLFGFAFCVL